MAALLRKVRDLSPLAEGSLWVSDYSPPVNPIEEWSTWDLWQYRGEVAHLAEQSCHPRPDVRARPAGLADPT
jgi:hypothetical protein